MEAFESVHATSCAAGSAIYFYDFKKNLTFTSRGGRIEVISRVSELSKTGCLVEEHVISTLGAEASVPLTFLAAAVSVYM